MEMSTIWKWLDWKPAGLTSAESGKKPTPKFSKTPKYEPSKPSKLPGSDPSRGFEGFEGPSPAFTQKIEAAPTEPERAAANAVLGRAGVRLMTLPEGVCVGIWSDTDSSKVRAALRIFGSDTLPVRYLDGADVPMRFKLRRVPGEPVPASVLAAMEQNPAAPWTVRDQMLKQMGWRPKGIRWRG
jgi:hypothetical protein